MSAFGRREHLQRVPLHNDPPFSLQPRYRASITTRLSLRSLMDLQTKHTVETARNSHTQPFCATDVAPRIKTHGKAGLSDRASLTAHCALSPDLAKHYSFGRTL